MGTGVGAGLVVGGPLAARARKVHVWTQKDDHGVQIWTKIIKRLARKRKNRDWPFCNVQFF